MAPISSSEVWYCTWTCGTTCVISAFIARKPLEVSVTWTPVRLLTSRAKTATPAWRTASSVSARPSTRDPMTKSASPAASGSSPVGISGGAPFRRGGREHGRDLVRVPLHVGVERDDEPAAELADQLVAEPQRDAVAAVAIEPGEVDTVVLGDHLSGAIAAAVIDHEDGDRQPAGDRGNRVQHGADAVLLVVGGDQRHDRGKPEALTHPCAELAQRRLPNGGDVGPLLLVGAHWAPRIVRGTLPGAAQEGRNRRMKGWPGGKILVAGRTGSDSCRSSCWAGTVFAVGRRPCTCRHRVTR